MTETKLDDLRDAIFSAEKHGYDLLLGLDRVAEYADAFRTRPAPSCPDVDGLVERLRGPHEWGYRDPVVGGFIADDAPFEAATALQSLTADRERLVEALGIMTTAFAGYADTPGKREAVQIADAALKSIEGARHHD